MSDGPATHIDDFFLTAEEASKRLGDRAVILAGLELSGEETARNLQLGANAMRDVLPSFARWRPCLGCDRVIAVCTPDCPRYRG